MGLLLRRLDVLDVDYALVHAVSHYIVRDVDVPRTRTIEPVSYHFDDPVLVLADLQFTM